MFIINDTFRLSQWGIAWSNQDARSMHFIKERKGFFIVWSNLLTAMCQSKSFSISEINILCYILFYEKFVSKHIKTLSEIAHKKDVSVDPIDLTIFVVISIKVEVSR